MKNKIISSLKINYSTPAILYLVVFISYLIFNIITNINSDITVSCKVPWDQYLSFDPTVNLIRANNVLHPNQKMMFWILNYINGNYVCEPTIINRITSTAIINAIVAINSLIFYFFIKNIVNLNKIHSFFLSFLICFFSGFIFISFSYEVFFLNVTFLNLLMYCLIQLKENSPTYRFVFIFISMLVIFSINSSSLIPILIILAYLTGTANYNKDNRNLHLNFNIPISKQYAFIYLPIIILTWFISKRFGFLQYLLTLHNRSLYAMIPLNAESIKNHLPWLYQKNPFYVILSGLFSNVFSPKYELANSLLLDHIGAMRYYHGLYSGIFEIIIVLAIILLIAKAISLFKDKNFDKKILVIILLPILPVILLLLTKKSFIWEVYFLTMPYLGCLVFLMMLALKDKNKIILKLTYCLLICIALNNIYMFIQFLDFATQWYPN